MYYVKPGAQESWQLSQRAIVTVAQPTAPVCAAFYVQFLPCKDVRKISVVFDISNSAENAPTHVLP